MKVIRVKPTAIYIVFISLLVYLIIIQTRIGMELREADQRLNKLEPQVPELLYESFSPPADTRKEYCPAEFELIAEDFQYTRPYYTPQMNSRLTDSPAWCSIPSLNRISGHRLFLIASPGNYIKQLAKVIGIDDDISTKMDNQHWYVLLLQCRVKDVYWQGKNLMVVVKPAARGYQTVAVKKQSSLPPAAWLLTTDYQVWEEAYH